MSQDGESLDRLRAEIRGIRGEFAARLKAVREAAVAAGANGNAFLATTALFDGQAPETLGSGGIGAGAGLFPSAVEMLRSIRFPPAGEACEIAPGEGVMSRAILEWCFPRTLHL
ncbi:MAG: hypothetical protein EBZ59_01650, partial [Planctomycetia bacterium]|nr:hypothetical protein [Planctomycetia bacterium]